MLVGQVVYCLLRVRCSLPKGYTRVVYSGSGPDRIGSCADVGRTCSAERVRRPALDLFRKRCNAFYLRFRGQNATNPCIRSMLQC